MPEMTIEDFDELQNCPLCAGLLKGDTVTGIIMKRCGVDPTHGYFFVRTINESYDTEEWFLEYRPWAP